MSNERRVMHAEFACVQAAVNIPAVRPMNQIFGEPQCKPLFSGAGTATRASLCQRRRHAASPGRDQPVCCRRRPRRAHARHCRLAHNAQAAGALRYQPVAPTARQPRAEPDRGCLAARAPKLSLKSGIPRLRWSMPAAMNDLTETPDRTRSSATRSWASVNV
jgi:hypothetical protein